MVRQFEETRRSQVAILLSAHPAEYSSADEFELAVSVTGSIGLHALADGKTLTVLGPHRALARHTRNQLLDGLSGVELDGRAKSFDEQAGTVAAQSPGPRSWCSSSDQRSRRSSFAARPHASRSPRAVSGSEST